MQSEGDSIVALTEEQKAARAEKRRLTSALKEEARAHRDEARRKQWCDDDMYLTREQAAAGEACRGCGLPIIDNLGGWPGTMYLNADERVEYDAAEARYREMHPNCDAHRWSMEGSRTTHCGFCCPPVPIPEKHLEDLRQFLASLPPRREEELDIWERTLTCGHRVEQSVHHSHDHPSFSTERCPECGVTRGVVTSEKIVTAESRKVAAQRLRADEVARAERDVAKAEKAARDARRKLDELRAKP